MADLAGSSLECQLSNAGVPGWTQGGSGPVTHTRVLFFFPFLLFEASAMVLALQPAALWEIHPALWDSAFCVCHGAARPCQTQSPHCPFFSSLPLSPSSQHLSAGMLRTDPGQTCLCRRLMALEPTAGSRRQYRMKHVILLGEDFLLGEPSDTAVASHSSSPEVPLAGSHGCAPGPTHAWLWELLNLHPGHACVACTREPCHTCVHATCILCMAWWSLEETTIKLQ